MEKISTPSPYFKSFENDPLPPHPIFKERCSNHVPTFSTILKTLSQLKRILFMSKDKKKWNKTEKDRKNMEKENNSNESDLSENEIPDLNSLKPKFFENKCRRYYPW